VFLKSSEHFADLLGLAEVRHDKIEEHLLLGAELRVDVNAGECRGADNHHAEVALPLG
jgi:hypothetical protein